MDANEFLKLVSPAGKKSRLAPFLNDIEKLRTAGCTLEQVQDFLQRNGITISVSGLSAYLRRQVQPNDAAPASTVRTTGPRPAKAPPVVEPEEGTATAASGSHNPADIDAIIGSQPDLDALAKFAKKGRSKK